MQIFRSDKLLKRLLLTIVFSLFIAFFIICIKNEFGTKLYKNANYGIESLITKGSVENLFIGSSMFRQGIDINEIERRIGEDSFILAYNGNQPVFEYLQLKYLLDNNVKIKKLYLDLYVYSAASIPKVSDERLLIHSDTKFKIEVWNILKKCSKKPVSLFWELFVTANNPSVFTFPITYKLTNTLYYKGGKKGNATKKEGCTELGINECPNPRCENELNEIQKDYIIKIIELAKKKNIELVFVESPKWHEISADEKYINLMSEYLSILNDMSIQYILSQMTAQYLNAGDDVIIPFDSNRPEYFIDKVHLSSKGSIVFSSQL